MNERLREFFVIGYGIMIAILYGGVGIFLWMYNDKLKFMPPQVNQIVAALLVLYALFRLWRAISAYFSAK